MINFHSTPAERVNLSQPAAVVFGKACWQGLSLASFWGPGLQGSSTLLDYTGWLHIGN